MARAMPHLFYYISLCDCSGTFLRGCRAERLMINPELLPAVSCALTGGCATCYACVAIAHSVSFSETPKELTTTHPQCQRSCHDDSPEEIASVPADGPHQLTPNSICPALSSRGSQKRFTIMPYAPCRRQGVLLLFLQISHQIAPTGYHTPRYVHLPDGARCRSHHTLATQSNLHCTTTSSSSPSGWTTMELDRSRSVWPVL